MDLLSPGIQVKELNIGTVVQSASKTIAGIAGRFHWGEIGTVQLVTDETDLGNKFGLPKAIFSATVAGANSNAVSFMLASSYLAYSNALRVTRVANINDALVANNARNSAANLTVGIPAGILVKNLDHYNQQDAFGTYASYFLLGKYAGLMGNSIKFSACFNANQFRSSAIPNGINDWILNKNDNGTKTLLADSIDLTTMFTVNDYVEFTYNTQLFRNKVQSLTTNKLTLVDIGSSLPFFPSAVTTSAVASVKKVWEFANSFGLPPSTNEFHLVVTDADGTITGDINSVLEIYPYLSTDVNARHSDGTTAYYKTILNNQSKFVWAGGLVLDSTLASTSIKTQTNQLQSGYNGTPPSQDDYIQASSLFLDKDNVNINVFIAPPLMDTLIDSVVPNFLVQSLAEVRKDLVVYLSPKMTDVVNVPGQELANVKAFRNTLTSTSYGFGDCNWKYMYDRYNNTFRWVPLSGDTAGTAARTDDELDAWWSHAGLNRGGIKNCVKLAWNPNQVQRDDLYQVGINPVITQNGVGTILYGDKTLLSRPSAFDRINVRRLFIVLEKAISNAAKYSLFEFNDEITRQRFISMVEPFLRDILARRGISDFKVICDTSNNTAQVINTNKFVGTVLIRPNYSINFITLTFVAVPNGISFDIAAAQA